MVQLNFKHLICCVVLVLVALSPSHFHGSGLGLHSRTTHSVHKGGIVVTQNQIAYWNMVENHRANLAKEQETHRSNVTNERLQSTNLSEIARSNAAKELLQLMGLQETTRSNMARESETSRHNQRAEMLELYSAQTKGLDTVARNLINALGLVSSNHQKSVGNATDLLQIVLPFLIA